MARSACSPRERARGGPSSLRSRPGRLRSSSGRLTAFYEGLENDTHGPKSPRCRCRYPCRRVERALRVRVGRGVRAMASSLACVASCFARVSMLPWVTRISRDLSRDVIGSREASSSAHAARRGRPVPWRPLPECAVTRALIGAPEKPAAALCVGGPPVAVPELQGALRLRAASRRSTNNAHGSSASRALHPSPGGQHFFIATALPGRAARQAPAARRRTGATSRGFRPSTVIAGSG